MRDDRHATSTQPHAHEETPHPIRVPRNASAVVVGLWGLVVGIMAGDKEKGLQAVRNIAIVLRLYDADGAGSEERVLELLREFDMLPLALRPVASGTNRAAAAIAHRASSARRTTSRCGRSRWRSA